MAIWVLDLYRVLSAKCGKAATKDIRMPTGAFCPGRGFGAYKTWELTGITPLVSSGVNRLRIRSYRRLVMTLDRTGTHIDRDGVVGIRRVEQ